MLGRTHVLSGACLALAGLPMIEQHVTGPLPVGTVAVGTIACAGAGLFPDTDTQGLAAVSFGHLSRGACHVIAWVSGGHRHLTHSLLGTGLFGLAAYGMSFNRWATVALLWICLGLAVRAFDHRHHRHDHLIGAVNAIACAGVAYMIVSRTHPVTSWHLLLPTTVVVGCLAHIAGDMLTIEGCPIFYIPGIPATQKRWHVANVVTDHWAEHWVVAPALIALIGYLTVARIGPLLHPVVATTATSSR